MEGREGKEKVCREMKNLRLVLIRYYDHIEFRNQSYETLSPCLREVVGWIVHEDEEKIILLSEKAVVEDLDQVANLKPSGFVILKSTIREVVTLVQIPHSP